MAERFKHRRIHTRRGNLNSFSSICAFLLSAICRPAFVKRERLRERGIVTEAERERGIVTETERAKCTKVRNAKMDVGPALSAPKACQKAAEQC